jgi:hypothetical protein
MLLNDDRAGAARGHGVARARTSGAADLLVVKVVLLIGFSALAVRQHDRGHPRRVDLLTGVEPAQRAAARTRFSRLSLAILYFATGCAIAALLYALVGFWCLAIPIIVAAAAMRIEE